MALNTIKRENRTTFTTLETTNYTILTEISAPLYEEYYHKTKIILDPSLEVQVEKNTDSENTRENVISRPAHFNTFCIDYDFFLSYPLAAAREIQEYNSNTMNLIRNNFDKEEEIREIITRVTQEAREKLEQDHKKIEKKDEYDAYVDNALVDMALRLKRKDTED